MKQLEDTLKEILEQVTKFRNDYLSNEQAVRTQLIEPVLKVLGWKTDKREFVRPNAPNEDGKIPDYTLFKNTKSKLVVEAKNLSVELVDDKVINQVANYCYNPGIEFGVLTNGVRWLLFNTFQKNPQERIVWQADLEKESIEAVARKISSFAYDNIDELENLIQTSKELEKNWNALISSTDSIVTIITQKLIEKIKNSNPAFKINQDKIKSFTESKLSELFELADIENEEEQQTTKLEPKSEQSEFSEVEDYIYKRQQKNKIREKISVTFPDNTKIAERKVVDTFVKTIQKIGPEKIKELNIYQSGVPLITETKDNFYNQHKLGKYWIMVHSATRSKILQLTEINQKLNLKLNIETYTPDNNRRI